MSQRRRGRPPKPDGERRNQNVRGRVPDDVYDALCRAARDKRMSIHRLVGDVLVGIFRGKTFTEPSEVL